MKSVIKPILLTSVVASLLSSNAGATLLLAGFSNFGPTVAGSSQGPDQDPYGYGVQYTRGSATLASVATGGSNDGLYGSSAIPTGTPSGNGYARSFGTDVLTASKFSLTVPVGNAIALSTFFFDAAVQSTNAIVRLRPFVNGVALADTANVNVSVLTGAAGSGSDYGDYSFSLSGINLIEGDTLDLVVLSTGGVRIDNIAIMAGSIVAIPEPGSLLAVGCLLGSGLLVRSRKSRRALTA